MKFLPKVNTDFNVNVHYILSRNIEINYGIGVNRDDSFDLYFLC